MNLAHPRAGGASEGQQAPARDGPADNQTKHEKRAGETSTVSAFRCRRMSTPWSVSGRSRLPLPPQDDLERAADGGPGTGIKTMATGTPG